MTNKELNNHPLVKFLKARRLWSEFQREVAPSEGDVKSYLKKEQSGTVKREHLILSAFIFKETKRRVEFWWDIHTDWKLHLEELQKREN